MTRFDAGNVALVTGAAGDIGRATAVRLAAEGATVVVADLPAVVDGLSATRRRCEEASPADGGAIAVTFDVTDDRAVGATLRELSDEVGPPDRLFNNAGYQGAFANVADVDPTDARRVLEVNVAGVLNVLQAVARLLRDAGRAGAIVNTASMAGVSGAPNMAAYSASKAAVIALTKSAAKDLAPRGIRVNAVSPGFIGPGGMWDNQVRRQAEVRSPYYADDEHVVADQMIGQVPLRRYGTVDEVAAAVSFLLSEDASYVTGHNVEIAGGAT